MSMFWWDFINSGDSESSIEVLPQGNPSKQGDDRLRSRDAAETANSESTEYYSREFKHKGGVMDQDREIALS